MKDLISLILTEKDTEKFLDDINKLSTESKIQNPCDIESINPDPTEIGCEKVSLTAEKKKELQDEFISKIDAVDFDINQVTDRFIDEKCVNCFKKKLDKIVLDIQKEVEQMISDQDLLPRNIAFFTFLYPLYFVEYVSYLNFIKKTDQKKFKQEVDFLKIKINDHKNLIVSIIKNKIDGIKFTEKSVDQDLIINFKSNEFYNDKIKELIRFNSKVSKNLSFEIANNTFKIEKSNKEYTDLIEIYLNTINFDDIDESEFRKPDFIKWIETTNAKSFDNILNDAYASFPKYYENNILFFEFIGYEKSRKYISSIKILLESSILEITKQNGSSEELEKKIKFKILAIDCCKKSRVEESDFEIKTEEYKIEKERKTYSIPGNPILMDKNYWSEFANCLTQINLLPTYWAKGIMIPTPSGPIFLPCPIVWKSLVVFHTPTSLFVLFLTVNGMLPFPVLWELRMLPLADSESHLLTMMRGAPKLIKVKTETKTASNVIIGGIDTIPNITRNFFYLKEDLPIIERLEVANPLYLKYLNEWLLKTVGNMGFIP
jgi:hypothetical protein